MFDYLIAIATLCQVATGNDHLWARSDADRWQLACQQYYVDCLGPIVGERNGVIEEKFIKCIKNRKVK